MDIKKQFALYEKTVNRLEKLGISNPLGQIIYLAHEIEGYRDKIRALEKTIKDLTKAPEPETLRRPWATHEKPYIELRPTCSECGAVLEKVAICHVCEKMPEFEYRKVNVTPPECPHCGAKFECIIFQAGMLMEVDE